MNQRFWEQNHCAEFVDVNCSGVGTRDMINLKLDKGVVLLNRGCGCGPVRIDDDGLRAIVDAANCKLATGSFAALADTSAVPWVGKIVRGMWGGMLSDLTVLAIEGDVALCRRDSSTRWYNSCDLKPLVAPTPPTPKQGPQTDLGKLLHAIVQSVGATDPMAFAKVDIVKAIEQTDVLIP